MAALGAGGAARAADQPQYAPPPAWVKPVPIPPAPASADPAELKVLLQNEQTRFGAAGDEFYSESAMKILSTKGLADMGNIALAWRPDTETLILHKVNILRDGQVIDALAGGKKVTVLRRETNLELAMLDGALTATLQLEGLQVGDVVDMAFTLRRQDPVLAGRSEGTLALARPGKVAHAYFRAVWAPAKAMRWRIGEGLSGAVSASGADQQFVADQSDVDAPKPPNGAPPRFGYLAQAEFSQFRDWAEISRLMAPLYDKAETLAADSPLRKQIQDIAAASPDPKARALAALELVQDKVRYLFLGMNNGGYVPADADLTWTRRFGDCKGKTVLLLALLHGLGIEAEPVLVSTWAGDGLDQRLPMVQLFDHVLVRAHIDGRTYWLDGTRMGDAQLDRPAPAFRWALPVRSAGADLAPIEQVPFSEPHFDSRVDLDATGGLDAPAPAHAEHVFRGDSGIGLGLALSGQSVADAQRALRDYWRGAIPWVEPKTTTFAYDRVSGVTTLTMDGTATIDWAAGSQGRDFNVADSAIGYVANFTREPGPNRDAPYAVSFPMFRRWTVRVKLPGAGAGFELVNGQAVDATVAGVRYHRTAAIDHGVATIEDDEQALAGEFPAADAPAAAVTLRGLADYQVAVRAPKADPDGVDPKARAAEEAKMQSGAEKEQRGDAQGALADFKDALAAPVFPKMSPRTRERALELYAWAAQQTHDDVLAHSLAVEATNLPDAAVGAWALRLQFAFALHDFDDAAISLSRLAGAGPGTLAGIHDPGVFEVARQARGRPRFELLAALHDAGWKPTDPFRNADALWLDLAARRIDEGDLARAKVIARDVGGPYDLIQMRADKRFDPIVSGEPARYDVSAALDRQLADLRTKAAAAPDQLEGVLVVARALLRRNRPADALAVLDAAKAKIDAAAEGAPAFSDKADQMGAMLEVRAKSLEALGRSEEGLRVRERSILHAEHSGSNFTQVLDLASRYNNLGQPQDALDLLEDFDPEGATPYGHMIWKEVLACAYAQTGDKPKLARAIGYLEAHPLDAPELLDQAQLCTNDEDGVAKSIVARLADPDTRGDTLLQLQTYTDSPSDGPWGKQLDARWRAVKERPEVRAAIRKVGRIEAYPVLQ
jgi:hypothetical protein